MHSQDRHIHAGRKLMRKNGFSRPDSPHSGMVQTWVARPESAKGVGGAPHALRRLRACHPKTGLIEPCPHSGPIRRELTNAATSNPLSRLERCRWLAAESSILHRTRAEHHVEHPPYDDHAHDHDHNPQRDLESESGRFAELVQAVFLAVLDDANPSSVRRGAHDHLLRASSWATAANNSRAAPLPGCWDRIFNSSPCARSNRPDVNRRRASSWRYSTWRRSWASSTS